MSKKRETTVCRVCLRSDTELSKCISLFEKYKHGLISENISAIANVTIQEGDGLPSKICPDCLLELDTALNFKLKCETSNNLLKSTHYENAANITKPEIILKNIKKEEPSEEEQYEDENYLQDDFLVELSELSDPAKAETNPPRGVVKKSKAIDLKLECNECGNLFKSKCKMKVHWKRVHMAESLICKACKRTFKSYKAFNKHKNGKKNTCMIASKVNIEGIGKSRVFHCKDCSYKSRRIKDMQSHLYTHSGDRPYVCNLCFKTFTQQSSLQGHQESAHKLFRMESTCPYCGKYLKGRNNTYRHLKRHREKGVQCDLCKKMLKNKKCLILHLQRHSGVKMYTCEICASSYYTLSELCNHRRTKHEKGKHIYKCNLCGYTTVRSETLKKHKARHTETNVPCLICGFFVPNAEALLQHQKRHVKKFQCSYCELKYARKDSLHKHIRSKHKLTFSSLFSKPVVVKKEAAPVNVYEGMIEIEVNPIQ